MYAEIGGVPITISPGANWPAVFDDIAGSHTALPESWVDPEGGYWAAQLVGSVFCPEIENEVLPLNPELGLAFRAEVLAAYEAPPWETERPHPWEQVPVWFLDRLGQGACLTAEIQLEHAVPGGTYEWMDRGQAFEGVGGSFYTNTKQSNLPNADDLALEVMTHEYDAAALPALGTYCPELIQAMFDHPWPGEQLGTTIEPTGEGPNTPVFVLDCSAVDAVIDPNTGKVGQANLDFEVVEGDADLVLWFIDFGDGEGVWEFEDEDRFRRSIAAGQFKDPWLHHIRAGVIDANGLMSESGCDIHPIVVPVTATTIDARSPGYDLFTIEGSSYVCEVPAGFCWNYVGGPYGDSVGCALSFCRDATRLWDYFCDSQGCRTYGEVQADVRDVFDENT